MQKNSKIFKTSFRYYFYPNRDEIGQEREKKNFVPNFDPTRPGLENSIKNSKQIQKTSFRHNFYPKRDEIGRKRGKKILVPNSVSTRPGHDYSKKIQKIKKPRSGIIFSQNGIR